MTAIPYLQVRKGMVLLGDDGELFHVVERAASTHAGDWQALLHFTLKNIKTGQVSPCWVHPDDPATLAPLDERDMQYVYQDGDGFVFLDSETFDPTTLAPAEVGDAMRYLREGDHARVMLHEDRPIRLELPSTVVLKVAEAVTAGGAKPSYKRATLETGWTVRVPPFIDAGETIAVDTRTGEYRGRA